MWEYGEASRLLTIASVSSDHCIYCRTRLLRFPAESFELSPKRLFVQLSICSACGWWSVYRVHQNELPRTSGIIESYSATIGCLKELDLTDISIPLGVVRQYLLAKQDAMFDVHPRVLEEVVCSIFKDFGWKARVTGYSRDNGIDVILDGQNEDTIGIQVKRFKNHRRIEAEQIRSLAGALMLGGHTRGIFITTTKYRAGAKKTAKKFKTIGIPIELLDAEKFLSVLGIAQHQMFQLNQEKIASYVCSTGLHVGSGLNRDFVAGEDLRARPVIASIYTDSELLELQNSPHVNSNVNSPAELPVK